MRLSRFLGVLPLCAALLAACSNAPQAAQPTAVPAATSAPEATEAPAEATAAPAEATAEPASDMEAQIQATLDDYNQAWTQLDAALLDSTIDPQSGAFRRLVRGRFDNYQESAIRSSDAVFNYQLHSVTPLQDGFVRADVRQGSYSYDWTFREVSGRWLLSEPSDSLIGKRESQQTEHFDFYTYPWADDINSEVMNLMEEAYSAVKEKLGTAPEKKPLVTILPTFGAGPPQDSGVLAYYVRGGGNSARAQDRIVIFAPGTYAFGGYPTDGGWQPDLLQTLTHEYTHLVNNRSFTPLARIPTWMSEGLAEYVSDSPRAGEVSAAVATDNIIPLIEENPADPVNPQDLQHMGILTRDVSLAYGLSYSLVAYIADTYGGLDGFWKLAQAYDESQNLDEALQTAFGVSYADFDTGWRAWLAQNY